MKIRIEIMDNFETSNLNFAACMLSWGARLKDTENIDDRRMVFVLESPPSIIWTFSVGEFPEPLHSGTFNVLFNVFSTSRMMLAPSFPSMLRNLKSIIYGPRANN
jgi:hypothetical protein